MRLAPSTGLRAGRLGIAVLAVAAVVSMTGVSAGAISRAAPKPASTSTTAATDWPTFLHDGARSGASTDSTLNLANATTLTKAWSYATGGSVVDSATVVNGVAYVGSWDGYEYALNSVTGALIWKTNLGTTTDPNCVYPTTAGITSAATVQGGVLYVGGGGPNWYALDAGTGAVLWSVPTGDNSPAGGHYNWSSPLIYNGNAYIGIASNCDNPLVQGQLLQVSLSTHAVTNVAKFVPDGQIGGGVWTSPTVDAATNTVFVSTGTINQYTQTLAQAVVALDADTLAVKSHWELPFETETYDSDWGTTPTLVTDSAGRSLLSVANKNGVLYTFNRNNLGAGPVWQDQLAPGGDSPTSGDATISSGAFVNSITVTGPTGTYTGPVLFYATGNTLIGGGGFQGSVRAFNPANGATLWTHTTKGPILGALAFDNGLLAYGQGTSVEVADATNGNSLYDYLLTKPVYSAAAFSGGRIYIGGNDNNEYAFGLPASVVTPPPDASCPAGFTCQDIGNPQVKGGEVVNADGSVTVTAGGSGARNAADQMRIITEPVTGDFQLGVEDVNQTGGAYPGWQAPQLGIMVRESNAPGAPYYAALQDPTYPNEGEKVANLIMFYRATWNAPVIELTQEFPAAFPRWVMVQRRGDTFQTLISADGKHYWLVPGTTHAVVMPTTLLGGVGVGSGAPNATTTATYKALTLGAPTQPYTYLATASPCPAGWTCRGVDNPNPPGDQTLSNGTWTLQGAGNGIQSGNPHRYGVEDSFHYVYQTVGGDQTITARFTGFGANPPPGAQAGIMMRASTDPHAPYYAVLMSPTGGGIVDWRVNPNIVTRTGFLPQASWTSPIWLQITRFTDKRFSPALTYYSAAYSPDGQNWTPVVGSSAAIDMGGAGAGPTLVGLVGAATASNIHVPATFTNVGIAATTAAPPGICPSGWTCAEVGSSHVAGNQTYFNKTFTVQASSDIWDVYDQFRFLSQPMVGDGTVSARVVSVQNGGEWQKAGVMIRSDAAAASDPQAPYYGVFITPQHGIAVQWRPTEKAATNQVLYGTATSPGTPVYLMASRYSDPNHAGTVYYTAYYSTDNVHFIQVPGSSVSLTLPFDAAGQLTAGIAADSYSPNLATTTFDNFVLLGSAPAPAGICPAQWSCEDVGGSLPPGTQTMTSGNWSVASGGSDIWNGSDQFHFDWQALPADGTATAHVTGQTAGGVWAKGGVMLRQNDAPGSPYYGVFATATNGVVVQWRSTTDASTSQIAVTGSIPTYLRVIRWTNTGSAGATYYQALTSSDGTTWNAVPGSLLTVSGLSGTLLAGLATDSYNQGSAATWTFDTVAVASGEVVPQGACPNGWTCEDVGAPSVTGAQNNNAGAWTVQGGGYDIWNANDQFRLVGQSLSADGTVSAHVTAQTSTNAWAKAGVMLRSAAGDPNAGAPYYAALVTPSNGIVVQWRSVQGGSSSNLPVSGAVPAYLRVARWTDSSGSAPVTYYTAYTSTNGTTWAAVPGSTMVLNITGTALGGLAVTSHDSATLSTVSFDTVSIAAGAPQPAGVCPAAWTCADIGGAAPGGGQDDNAGAWTVQGGGSDIVGTTDRFRFIWQALAGDGAVSAQVTSQSNTGPWAKAGMMVRASTNAGAAEYSVLLTPNNGVTVQYRASQDALTTVAAGVPGVAPLYVEIIRSGTGFSAATSADGVTWTTIPGSSVSIPALSGALLAGMAVTSHDSSTLGTVTFNKVQG